MGQTLTRREEGKKKKEAISLKDSKPWSGSRMGAGPNTCSLESLLWVLVAAAAAAQTPTAHPRGGSDCRRTKAPRGIGLGVICATRSGSGCMLV